MQICDALIKAQVNCEQQQSLECFLVTHLSHCCLPCRLPGVTACSPHQSAGHRAQQDLAVVQSCVLVLVHDWEIPVHGRSRKVQPEQVTELHQGRKKYFNPYWRLKCIPKKNESLNVRPRQIHPVGRERPIFLIYPFWQGVQPECRTQVTISSIKQWGSLAAQYCPRWTVWHPPCDPDNKATAGSSAVLLAMAAISNKNTEAFLILQRQKMKYFSSYAMLALPQQRSNQYGTKQSQWFISRGFELGFVGKKASALLQTPGRLHRYFHSTSICSTETWLCSFLVLFKCYISLK